MLEALITSKARIAILKLFFMDQKRDVHLREVSRLLSINVNQARRELERLSAAGILAKSRIGRMTLFQANTESPSFDELRSIIRKSVGAESLLRKELGTMKGIRVAFIFGSYAEGKDTYRSDIDVMIIGEPDISSLNRRISKLEKDLNRSIQYVVYPVQEFEKKKGYGFIKNVLERKKISILGDLDELVRTEAVRKGKAYTGR